MAKFINKKEQVWDLQLTPYGREMLSVGGFNPTYYSFYDDNVTYDNQYVSSSIAEPQNNIHNRIKNETQYLESLTLFEELEKRNNEGWVIDPSNLKDLPSKVKPRKNIFKFDSAIGDAYFEGDSNVSPAWKVVALGGTINNSAIKDVANEQNIPQINMNASYVKKVQKAAIDFDPQNVRGINLSTGRFVDNRVIVLEQNDPLFYLEEVNTQLLTENFEAEVFEVTSSSTGEEVLMRKFFESFTPQIQDGLMVSPTIQKNPTQDLTVNSVEYYFDLLADKEIDQTLACRGAEVFNKQSYYVNLDFDCDESADESVFYDIYGSVTEPEICLD